jgi:hypothetical protein
VPSREIRASALVTSRADGTWAVIMPDGEHVEFEDSLAAELHAMAYIREHGGGELLVRDRKNRPPRRLVIRGA